MKSIQVYNVHPDDPDEQSRYSELQVMSSAAGWYIGTIYMSEEGYQEPGSRDSCYFSSKERAEYALKYLEGLEKYHRNDLCPEDIAYKWAIQMYTLGYDPLRVGYRFWP